MKLSSLFLAVAAVLASPAAAVTWTLENVSLSSSALTERAQALEEVAQITGRFDYDADTNIYSNIELQVTGVPGVTPMSDPFAGEFQTAGVSYPFGLHAVRSRGGTQMGAAMVLLSFGVSDPLTGFGGDVPIVTSHVGYCSNDDCTNSRFVTNGASGLARAPDTSPIPLPPGLPLLAAGLVAMTCLRRRTSLRR